MDFLPARGAGTMTGFRKLWDRIAGLGELPTDVTPPVLPYVFEGPAGDIGYSEPSIAAPIGRMGHTITSRCVDSADAVLLAAADAVARRTAEPMGEAVPVVDLMPLRAAG